MTDISMGQRSRSGRGVFADTGDQLLNFSFKYGDPVAIPRPYDSGAMGWAIARDLVSVGHVQDQRLRFRGCGVGYRPEKNCTWVADPRLNFVSFFSVGSTRLIQLPSQNFLRISPVLLNSVGPQHSGEPSLASKRYATFGTEHEQQQTIFSRYLRHCDASCFCGRLPVGAERTNERNNVRAAIGPKRHDWAGHFQSDRRFR